MAYSKALIVDDSKLARITLKRKIEALGLTVILAESGKQALEVIASESPDIIFMDHLMPEMDGFEATQSLRADPKYAALPIIMCTGKDHDGYLEEARAIGANQILSKPPVDDALQAILATEFSAGTAVLDVVPETAESVDASLEPSSIGAEAPILDMDMLSGDELLIDLVDDASDDLLADFSSDLGANILEAVAPQATPIAQPIVAPAVSGLDEAAVKALLDQAVANMSTHFNQQLAAQKIEFSNILEQRIVSAIAAMPEPTTAAALPESQVEGLCQSFFEKERISLIAEVLASVPEPEIPHFEVPKIDYDRVDQQLISIKSDLIAVIDEKIQTSQTTLIQKVELLLKQKLAAVQAGLAESDVELIAKTAITEHVNGSGAAITADLQQQLKQREKILLQHLEMNKASVAGLLAEVQSEDSSTSNSVGASNDIIDEIDILRLQQQQLSDRSAPKTLAFMGVGLGFAALVLAVYGFIQ